MLKFHHCVHSINDFRENYSDVAMDRFYEFAVANEKLHSEVDKMHKNKNLYYAFYNDIIPYLTLGR